MGKNRLLALVKILIKGVISMSWIFAFSTQRKVLNFLTSEVWFSPINSHLLMCQLLVFVANLVYTLVPPLPLLLVPQSFLRGSIPGLSSQKVCQIKHNSQLSGCVFYFFQSTIGLGLLPW